MYLKWHPLADEIRTYQAERASDNKFPFGGKCQFESDETSARWFIVRMQNAEPVTDNH